MTNNDFHLPPVRYVTSRLCTAHCPYCHREGVNDDKMENNESLVKSVISKMRACGFTSFNIAGGDPIEVSHVASMAAYAKRLGFSVGLTTLGKGMAYGEWLTVSQNIDRLHLSIPSFDEETYRSWTGIDLNTTLASLSIVRNLVSNIRINHTLTTISPISPSQIYELVDNFNVDICIQDILWSPTLNKSKRHPLYCSALEVMSKMTSASWTLKAGYSPTLVSEYKNKCINVRSSFLTAMQSYPICLDCHLKEFCDERVCSIRVYPNGNISACFYKTYHVYGGHGDIDDVIDMIVRTLLTDIGRPENEEGNL